MKRDETPLYKSEQVPIFKGVLSYLYVSHDPGQVCKLVYTTVRNIIASIISKIKNHVLLKQKLCL